MKNLSTIILLGLIAIVGVFTLDVYLPGMPAMANQFNVSIKQIAFTFTSFSIVFAISQLFHGVISDYMGRKPVLVIGLSLAAIATLFCSLAKNYDSLFYARIFQAVGISTFVVVNAIIRDLYTGATAIQVRTYVVTISGISISIAPTIGGLLQNHYDWQGGFIASLLLIIVALVYAILFFQESNMNLNKSKWSLSTFIKSYIQLFSDKNYVSHIMMSTLAYTVHFTFIILSAKIFMNEMKFTSLTFGYLMFVYGGIYFASGLTATFVAKRFSISSLINFGTMTIMAAAILMLQSFMMMPNNVWGILLPVSLMTLGITMIRSAATTGALATIPNQAGQGAAGLNLMQFMLSALIATGVSEIDGQSELSLAILAVICSMMIMILANYKRFFISDKLIKEKV